MKKQFAIILMAAFMATGVACTNMSPTQQGVASGAALGTLGGAGVAAISGGSVGWGALAGAGMGALAGGIVGNQQEKSRYHHRGWSSLFLCSVTATAPFGGRFFYYGFDLVALHGAKGKTIRHADGLDPRGIIFPLPLLVPFHMKDAGWTFPIFPGDRGVGHGLPRYFILP